MTGDAIFIRQANSISIHIPRVGDDVSEVADRVIDAVISIHIPRVGDDGCFLGGVALGGQFQSTSPVWGMTDPAERDRRAQTISIHIPRVGDDPDPNAHLGQILDFNPHPPCGG